MHTEHQKISQFLAGETRRASSTRDGRSYDYFLPRFINVDFDVDVPKLQFQLEKTSLQLGKLNATAGRVPDLSLFIQSFVNSEAASSSRIEGTHVIMEDLFKKEEVVQAEKRDDRLEASLYIKALQESINALPSLPVCNRLLKDAHETLLSSGRGKNKLPGKFRLSQNHVGGSSLQSADFIPPHNQHVEELMHDLEEFLNAKGTMPELIRVGIAHYQFETIHPFEDGNGRVGRMLIVLFLIERGLLEEPLLYPSAFLEEHKDVYFDKLTRVRTKNDLAGWLLFFLEGVEKTAALGIKTLDKVLLLKKSLTEKIHADGRHHSTNTLRALDFAFESPLLSAQDLQQNLKVSLPTAYKVISVLVDLGILQKDSAQRRNQVFRFAAYLDIFQQPLDEE